MATIENYAYLAGVMDSDGYFMPGINSGSFGFRVAVRDKCLIDFLASTFGGCASKGGKTSVGNQLFTWTLQQQDVLLTCLRNVSPFLVIKKKQAAAMERLILHLKTRPSYEKKTKDLSDVGAGGVERRRRREVLAAWRNKRGCIQQEIKEAR